jgi:S-adenosylmethionine synthetase
VRTKVDRSAAYAARYVAKSIVKAKLAKKAEVQLSYAIGVAKPISILVDTFDTGVISQANLTELIKEHFDLRPAAIIKEFNLRNLPKKMGVERNCRTKERKRYTGRDLKGESSRELSMQ